ncbi:MAG: bacterial transcriptional activator domain-containing protein [Caldilineaceae bacterium]|nr:bacterial transcriptional activator domain-containing protein [Caldilineaceae bacterium]
MIIPQSFDETTLRTLSPVVISVFGSVRLILGGTPVPLVRESKSAHLLICLALAKEHRLSRCRILETIWPEADSTLAGQALNSLNHQLNKMSAKYLNGAGLVVHETGYYQLNAPHRVWIDIDHFAQWSEAGRQLLSTDDVAAGVSYCEQALALYQGDLCGDSSIHTLFERERLRAAFLDLLVRLAEHYYRHGDPGKALHYTQRVLAHDSCREDAHRQAMRCYVRLGQRAQAFRHYRLCCQALATEFDAQPEPATAALYEQIRLDPASV